MPVCEGGNLSQMRHAEDLIVCSEIVQSAPDGRGYPPADAGIHFVEDQGPVSVTCAASRLYGQHDP